MKQTQWHSSKGNSCRQMTLTKQKLLLEILYTLYVATKTSRIPREAKRFFGGEIFCLEYPSTRSEKGNVHFANYIFSFRKLQILISQTTDSHFANYRFSFRKLQISISQTTDFHFVSQTTVSRLLLECSLWSNASGLKRFLGKREPPVSGSNFLSLGLYCMQLEDVVAIM